MKRSRLARERWVTGQVVIGVACLALAACSGASYGDVPYYQPHPQTSLPAGTKQLCQRIDTAMEAVDGGNVTSNMTLVRARAQVDNLMQRGIAAFSTLAVQVPASLRPTVRQIVTDFRTVERSINRAASVRQILDTVASGSPAEQPSYEQLVAYVSDNC
jgi:hypothetical protein